MRRFADGTVPDRGTSVPAARTAPAARFGRYDVFEKLGNGGMATVHRAEVMIDASADGRRRQVALKRLHAHLAEDRMFVEAFVDEARLASRLLHPNTVRAHELGKIDNTYYMAMEYVPGRTLAELATRRAPLAATVELLVQLCDALAFAHELRGEDDRPLGVIHRDVTPANVIVSREGVVKLIDFGIARSAMARHRTRTGIIKGKLAYVAPEYLSGSIDARGDLFGLGVIAHELLCGRRLFLLDDDLATLNNVCSGEVVAPSRHNAEVPPELDDIVLTALERDPDRRWQSARALGVALRGVARQLGVVVDGRHLRAWAFPAMAEGTRDPANEDLEPSIHVAALSPLRLPTEAFGPDPADWRDRRSARASRRG
jgi:serine/threonine protein kinase